MKGSIIEMLERNTKRLIIITKHNINLKIITKHNINLEIIMKQEIIILDITIDRKIMLRVITIKNSVKEVKEEIKIKEKREAI